MRVSNFLPALAVLCLAFPASAQDRPEGGEPDLPRNLAFGLSVLGPTGTGLVAKGRFGHVAIEAAFGFTPYFVFLSGGCSDFLIDAAMQATGSVIGYISADDKRFQHAIRASGMWSDKLGPGASLGYTAEFFVKDWLALEFGGGIRVNWEAEELIKNQVRAETKCGAHADQLTVLDTAVVVPYLTFNLLFYVL